MATPQIFETVLRSAWGQSHRTSALRPLTWFVGLLLTALLTSIHIKAPEWLTIALFVMTSIAGVGYLIAYFYLLFVDRDYLRSERYYLEKMPIERGLIGDNQSCLTEELTLVKPPDLLTHKSEESEMRDE